MARQLGCCRQIAAGVVGSLDRCDLGFGEGEHARSMARQAGFRQLPLPDDRSTPADHLHHCDCRCDDADASDRGAQHCRRQPPVISFAVPWRPNR
jgi:hypothetical protein